MAKARNTKQLNALLMLHLNRAMNEAAFKSLSDMRDETVDFYTGEQPKIYQRTGELAQTPAVSKVSSSSTQNGGSASFEAYYNTQHKYTTGKRPSMATVLDVANRGLTAAKEHNLRPAVGKTGFIDRAEEKVKKSTIDALSKHFYKK